MLGFSYDPLWKILIDNKMTKEQLRTALNISPTTIAKMGRGENVSLELLGRICDYFNCEIEDIVKHDKKEEPTSN
jgi:putative transcriptional regulator